MNARKHQTCGSCAKRGDETRCKHQYSWIDGYGRDVSIVPGESHPACVGIEPNMAVTG